MARKNSKAEGGAATLELPTSSSPNSLRVEDVQISQIMTSGRNHRIHEDGIEELAASMAVSGLEQPIKVRGRSAVGYELVFGHRRLAAAIKLGWKSIPAIVVDTEAPLKIADDRAIENLQRADLNPIEAALAVGEIMDEELAAARKRGGLADDQEPTADVADTLRQAALKRVSERIGKPIRWVRDHVFLGTLDKTTRELVVNGKLPWEHARELAKVADIEKRAEIAKRAAISGFQDQPVTLSELRHLVAPHLRSLGSVHWKLDVEFAGAPACTACPQNSKNQTGLFEHHAPIVGGNGRFGGAAMKEPEAGVCLNAACFGRKSGLANRQMSNAAKKVQVTVSAAPKAEREKVQKTTVAKLAPAVVKPAAFAAAVKDKLESKATAKSSAPTKTKPRAETPEIKAERAFDSARGEWLRHLDRQVDEALLKKPATLHLLCCIDRLKHDGSAKSIKRIRALVEAACDPNRTDAFDLICKEPIDKHVQVYWDAFDSDFKEEMIQFIANRLGVKPKNPEPKLEDFLPKEKAEKPAKPAKGKKPAKASGPEGPLGYCHQCLKRPAIEHMAGFAVCADCLEDLK